MSVELLERACPVCGSEDRSRLLADSTFDPRRLDRFAYASRKTPDYMHHRLVVCPVCDLVYATPAPTAETLARAYSGAAYDSAAEARLAARTYERLVRPLVERLPDCDGAIDVGAGDGAFLERLLGFGFASLVGFEPSAAPLTVASERVRPLIRNEPFSVDGLEPGRYSLATCFQTMEHLTDPLGVCRELRTLLKAGGALLLVCHDRRALSARLLGRRSPIFDVEHLQLFSRRSIQELLARAGFHSIAASRVVNVYELSYWARLAPFPDAIKPGLLRVLRRSRAGKLRVPLPAGNLAAFGFR
jgi:SAM-dependent methyltransferase